MIHPSPSRSLLPTARADEAKGKADMAAFKANFKPMKPPPKTREVQPFSEDCTPRRKDFVMLMRAKLTARSLLENIANQREKKKPIRDYTHLSDYPGAYDGANKYGGLRNRLPLDPIVTV